MMVRNDNINTRKSLLIGMALLCGPVASGAKSDWAEGATKNGKGATREFYNAAAFLPWKNFMGDWADANGAAQGEAAYTSVAVAHDDQIKAVELDVTRLVAEWIEGTHSNKGFFLRAQAKGNTIRFASREVAEKARRPILTLVGEKGTLNLNPVADTFLDKSTYKSSGHKKVITLSGAKPILIRFGLPDEAETGKITKATLTLTKVKQYGATGIEVFRCNQGHDLPDSDPIMGLAARYPGDEGIAADAAVVFATGFESENWTEEWSDAGVLKFIETVSEDRVHKFKSLQGNALRVKVAEGENAALNARYDFRKKTGREPKEIFFRYYLRLGSDWKQTTQGGKMPGISGTYGVAGWGGRKVNGKNGWSARGSFRKTIPEGNPLAGLHPLGTYCYHAEMDGIYGDSWVWNQGYRGFLESNRWYSIEQHLKLNTPGKNDGIIEVWIDGRLAFEKKDIRFRDIDKLKIERIWMNVYHGGKAPSPYDQHLFIDNVVVAKEYIGPMKSK